MQCYTVYFIWKLLYMFRVVPPPIIRSANNCIYSIWYLSRRYCYLPLSWKSWNWFEYAVGGVRHPQHTQTGSNSTRPPSAWRKSFQLITFECIKDSAIGEKADIETFVITECNGAKGSPLKCIQKCSICVSAV